MGYETTMYVIDRSKTGTMAGYSKIIASVELAKVCCDKFGDLITKHKNKSTGKLKQVQAYKDLRDTIYTDKGEHTEEHKELSKDKQEKRSAMLYRKEKALKLPYIFAEGGNEQCYTDRYGDLLIVAPIKDVLEAMVRDQAHMVASGEYESIHGYRRFDVAIPLLKAFMNDVVWDELEVVLYGH